MEIRGYQNQISVESESLWSCLVFITDCVTWLISTSIKWGRKPHQVGLWIKWDNKGKKPRTVLELYLKHKNLGNTMIILINNSYIHHFLKFLTQSSIWLPWLPPSFYVSFYIEYSFIILTWKHMHLQSSFHHKSSPLAI